MKKLLLYLTAVFSFILLGNNAFAQTGPTITYSPTSYTLTAGTAANITPTVIAGVTGSFGWSAPVVTISPALANGTLAINAGTGKISGTPATAATVVTYTITATCIKFGNGPRTASATITITIVNPPAPSLSYTPSSYTVTYGTAINATLVNSGGAISGVYSYTGTLPTGMTFTPANGTISGTPSVTATTVITVQGTNAGGTSTTTLTITVNPASLTVTATGPAKPYGTALTTGTSATNFTAAGAIAGQAVTSVTLTPDANGASSTTPIGSAYIVTPSAATGSGGFLASNYNITYVPFNGTVGLGALTITATGVSKVYGNVLTGGTGSSSFTETGLASGETVGSVTIAYGTGSAATDAVGTYNNQITPSAATGGTFNPANYNITYAKAAITVTGAPLTITATGPTKTYGTALTTGPSTTNFTATAGVLGQTATSVTLTPNGAGLTATTPAGSAYTVTPSAATGTGGFLASNYSITYVPYNGTVAQASLTVTATGPAKPYGTALTTGTSAINFTAAGAITGQAVTSVTLTPDANGASSTTPVGSAYVVTPSAATGSGGFLASNYSITYVPFNGTVSLGALTITATGVSKVYGNVLTGGTGSSSFTETGLASGETAGSVTIAYGTGSAATDAVGTYTSQITPSAATGGTFNPANYNITYTKGAITVTGAPLTITATGPTKTYGTALTTGPSTTNFTATAGVLGQVATSVTLTPNGAGLSGTTAAGSAYTVTPSAATGTGGFLASNYNITYVPYGGTVAKAPLTITANTNNKPYGTTLTGATGSVAFTATGLQNGNTVGSVTIAYGTGAAATTALGAYASQITVSAATGGAFLASNYTITYVQGTINVTPANLTITANSVTKIYGVTLTGGAGSAAFTSTGLVNGEIIGSVTITYGTGAAATDAVGTYTGSVTPSAATGGTFTAANYNITYAGGNIIVNPPPPVLSYINPAPYTVGTAIPSLGPPTNTGGAVAAPGTNAGTTILTSTNGLNNPYGMAVDASGNLYVANFSGNSIVEYSTTGTVTTYAMGSGTGPVGIVFDSSGNAYVLDQTSKQVVKFTGGNLSGAGTALTGLGLNTATGIAIDASNNLYIADSGNNNIKKYSGGTVTTIAAATVLVFGFPVTYGHISGGVAVDASGNIYVADNQFGNIGLGGGTPGVDVYNSAGTFTAQHQFGTTISGVYIDGSGNIYVTDTGAKTMTEYSAGFASTILTESASGSPRGVVSDGKGDFFISDYTANTVTEYAPSGGYALTGIMPPGLSFNTTTGVFSGTPQTVFGPITLTVTGYNAGGNGSTTVTISCGANPPVISYTPSTNVYPVGTAITPLGPPTNTGGPIAPTGYNAGTSFATGLTQPWGLTLDAGGNIWVAQNGTNRVTRYTSAGVAANHTVAATGNTGIAVDAAGNFYVSNTNGNVYKYNPGGTLQSTNTTAATNNILNPGSLDGIAVDASGNLYFTDVTEGIVWKYTASTGVTSQLIVTPSPVGITVDGSGNIYVVDQGASKAIKEYNSSGIYETTIVSGLNTPYSIYRDANGDFYVGDLVTNTIKEYNALGTLIGSTAATNPRGITMDASGNFYASNYTAGTITKYPPYYYALSGGTLPTNLVFNTTTGSFTGTPTVAFPTTTFTISVYGSYGNASTTVTITCATAPVFSYTSPQTYTVGMAISTLSPIVSNGGPITSASVSSPSLPAGLSIDASGNITGTPTVATAMATYTISASNSSGLTGTATVVITCVNPPAPVIAYTTPDVYTTGVAIAALDPNNTGGTATWSISAALPAGLNFDTATGLITGIPTIISPATNYLVTATNAGGTVSETINITCNPPAPVIAYTTPDVYTTGIAIATLDPNNTGGPATWSISAALPAGLNFDTATGLIIGTPTVISPATDYLVTVTNAGGTVSETINITCNPPAPVISYVTPDVYIAGVAITPLSPVNSGGAATSYSIIPTLPLGLSYDTTTGIISGTPAVATSVTNYYVTATNAGGTSTFTIVITVNLAPPVIAYATPDVFTVGTTITPLIPANTGGTPTSYSISSALPAGLNFDTTTGIIYGTPSAVTAAADYVITAASGGGSGAFTVNITVNAAGPVIAYATPDLFPVGIPIAPLTPVSTGSAPTGYSISAALPAGLSFDTTTGIISGTPTTVTAATSYTVTATNGIGSGTATITISCNGYTDWLGGISNDWNTPGNWASGIVPVATDIAAIGVNVAFTNFPNVGPFASTVNNVGAVVIGTNGGQAGGFAVNTGSTLNISGGITYQSDLNSALPYTASISGGGTVNAAGINVVANTTLTPVAASYTENMTTSVGNLNLTSNIALTSSDAGGNAFNSTFSIIGGTVQVLGAIQTTNTSGGTSTIAVVPSASATLQLANVAPLGGLSATGANVVNFDNPGATIEYSGANQTFYTDAAIPGLPSGVAYRNIAFSGTGIKTAASGNLNIPGDFSNTLANDAADYVDFTAPAVNFNGTTQNLAGGPANGTTFYNVTFSGLGTKTMTSGNFHVASSGILTMSGSSSSTILAANGALTLNSDATGSAIVPAFTGPQITGNVNAQRYLTGGSTVYRGYRLLTSIVNNGSGIFSINYLKNSCYLTGTTAAAGGFDNTGNGNPTLYLFRENLAVSNASFTSGNFRGINNITAAPSYSLDGDGSGFNIPAGNGFLFFFRGDRSTSFANKTTYPYPAPENTTLTATGTLNQGQITVKDWYTPTSSNLGFTNTPGNSTIQGLNLVGNPYPSSIDWDTYNTSSSTTGIYAPSLAPFTYIIDPFSKNYSVYQSGFGGIGTIATTYANVIPSGQGFFVIATDPTAQLVFNESAKTNLQANATNGNLFLGTPVQATVKQYLHLKLTKDSVNSVNADGIFISFNSSAKSQYIKSEDAIYKPGNGIVSFTSLSADSLDLAINCQALPKQNATIIPLNVNATTDGAYQVNMASIKSVPDLFDIWLMDAWKKDSLDIKHNPIYSFNILKSDPASYGSKRFTLVIRQNPALSIHLLNFAATKATGGAQIVWITENEQNYTNFTVERSSDGGSTFNVLGGFPSSALGTYGFLDKAPPLTADKYRLKIEDINGNISYSNVVTLMYGNINANSVVNNISVYPNPASSIINLSIAQNSIAAANSISPSYHIMITNSSGSVIRTGVSLKTDWQDNVSTLLPGTYVIQVVNANDNSVVGRAKFIKL